MHAFVFPGQGAQFVGMGKDLYDNVPLAKELFDRANEILGFPITDIMFAGTDEQLKQTKVTQPAIFLHSVILARSLGDAFKPDMAAGHSLGEFSALVAAGALGFEDGLKLVSKRAMAMQKACEQNPSTMAAIIALPFGLRAIIHTDYAAIAQHALFPTLFVLIVPTYLPNLMLNYALKTVQPTVSSIYTYLQPVLAIAMSVAMGLDKLHLDTVIFALVIFTGVALVLRSYATHPDAPASRTH